MPKIATQLNILQLKLITKVGWQAVGGVAGILLQVRKATREGAQMPRSWILRIKIGDQRQPICIGSYPQVSLAIAREQAAKLVVEAKQGVNLKAKKCALRSSLLSSAAKNKTSNNSKAMLAFYCVPNTYVSVELTDNIECI